MNANLTEGLYLLRFRWAGVDYARKVLVDDGGYYRFVDEFDKPLPDSLPISAKVTLSSGDSKLAPLCRIDPNDENIHWNDASETTPDDGMNVLIKAPFLSEPTWIAYLEDNTWYFIDGSPGEDVTFWADLPLGPVEDDDKTNGVTADLPPRQPLLGNAVAMATSGCSGIGFGEGLRNV